MFSVNKQNQLCLLLALVFSVSLKASQKSDHHIDMEKRPSTSNAPRSRSPHGPYHESDRNEREVETRRKTRLANEKKAEIEKEKERQREREWQREREENKKWNDNQKKIVANLRNEDDIKWAALGYPYSKRKDCQSDAVYEYIRNEEEVERATWGNEIVARIKRGIEQEKEKEREKEIEKEAAHEQDALINKLEEIFQKTIKPVCFTDGTKVKSIDDQGRMIYRELQTIVVGDKVWTCNFERHACELRPVVATSKREVTKVLQIATDTETLEVTPEHPFYVANRGWIEAKKLKTGDTLHGRLDTVNKVASIEEVSGNFHVYNIEVEAKTYDSHNYFVSESDLLVHNCNLLAGAALVAGAGMLLAGGSVAGVVIVLNSGITIAKIASADTLAQAAADLPFDLAMQVGLNGLGAAAKHLGSQAGRVLEFGKLTKAGRDKILDSAKSIRHSAKKFNIPQKDLNWVTNGSVHVFGKNIDEHKLSSFLNLHKEDKIAAYMSIKNAAQKLADQGQIKGIFEKSISVKGTSMTVRGNVIDGVARINTAFIP